MRNRLRSIGRVPLAVGSLVVGALIPWAVNAYAPVAVEKATAVPPFEVAAGIDAAGIGDYWKMALAREVAPDSVPTSVDSCDTLRRWLTQQGGSDVETTWIVMSFRGLRIDPVVVTSVRVVIDDRRESLTGSAFDCPSAGAGENNQVGVNLDEPTPVLRELDSDGKLASPWFRTNSLTLERGEVVTFSLQAFAYKADYTWHLEAAVRVGGREEIHTVPGEYRTTATAGSYGQAWSWDWSKTPGRLAPMGTI